VELIASQADSRTGKNTKSDSTTSVQSITLYMQAVPPEMEFMLI